jgi:tungstate transport system substrate-binding protein
MEIDMQFIRALLPLAAMLTLAGAAQAQALFITVASTTSTEQSGLFPFLLPAFTKASGIEVHIVAVGTGQALAIGEHGDADVVFVHDKPAELKFLEAGYGVDRREVMYNDFILVGPKADPAHIGGGKDIVAALKQIAAQKQPFLSRGDSSGTDAEEKRLWGEAGIDVKTASGGWYRELGQGMGPTLHHQRSRHLAQLQEPAGPRDIGRGRHQAVQPIRRHAGEPEALPEREGEAGHGLHRLADLAAGPGGHRPVPDRRQAALLPQLQEAGGLKPGSPGPPFRPGSGDASVAPAPGGGRSI